MAIKYSKHTPHARLLGLHKSICNELLFTEDIILEETRNISIYSGFFWADDIESYLLNCLWSINTVC